MQLGRGETDQASEARCGPPPPCRARAACQWVKQPYCKRIIQRDAAQIDAAQYLFANRICYPTPEQKLPSDCISSYPINAPYLIVERRQLTFDDGDDLRNCKYIELEVTLRAAR